MEKNTCPLRTEIQFRVSVLPDLVIAWLAGGRPICLITSMITDQIERNEVLLPINHNYNKICDILGFSKSKHEKFCSHGIEEKKVI